MTLSNPSTPTQRRTLPKLSGSLRSLLWHPRLAATFVLVDWAPEERHGNPAAIFRGGGSSVGGAKRKQKDEGRTKKDFCPRTTLPSTCRLRLSLQCSRLNIKPTPIFPR